ncbi:hypothetical protein INP51_10405 [Blautia liquoris]|uniref:Uncharacterized protein n=1 Tax=Blautia liquoris TaxID=2779518 RepID=A0A7M2RDQ7_9FIRM|nr:hypothetical protein [Blautia liquoris]QOV18426.1 hypothetical protein INP51_10405 [Blautia liquoris]
MSEIKYTFTANGENWTKSQLERLEYERNLHMLHLLKRHGVEIKDGDKVLSDAEIDYLTMEKAWDVSIKTRMQYKGDKIIDLYKDDFKLSDEMWKKLGFSQEKPMKVSRCNMSVTGISLQDFAGMMKSMQTNDYIGLASHPEHFICHISFDDGKLLGIEPFGMYGTPTLVNVDVVEDSKLSDQIRADKDPSFPMAMAGETFLADGVTPVNCPYHQFKPTADGFETKAAVYWPENTPDEIVSGHALHLAMEFSRGMQLSQK